MKPIFYLCKLESPEYSITLNPFLAFITTPADIGVVSFSSVICYPLAVAHYMNDVTYFKDCVTIILNGWQTFAGIL